MSEFFSGKRFQLLILQHWADNRKRYLLSILAYIGLLMLWFFVAYLAEPRIPLDPDLQKATFYISLFALGTTYASQYYSHFSSRARGINFLMVPASQFEKMLCSLLYTVLLFLAVITVCFYLVDLPMTYLLTPRAPVEGVVRASGPVNVFEVKFFNFPEGPYGRLLFFYLSVQSAFLLGSVLFNRFSFLKTCIIGLVTFFIGFIIVYLANKTAFDNDTIDMFPVWVRRIIVTLSFVIPPVIWASTYFRLKAKQV